jgi:aspartyl-tRNA(Asn)/glutamyl-tRNA(Gln) amidotransferase subunit A
LELCDRTAHELSRKIRGGEIRPFDIVESVLKRISAVESEVGSYITLDVKGAERRAQAFETCAEPHREMGPLGAMPVAIKDNICTRGLRTTCASMMLENYVPPYSATAVDRLEAAGAVVLGKTNLDEFGMGSSTEHSALGVTRNPWKLDRVPGGSSGGSAAAVCAGEAVIALGSDTGGSVRLPAAFCGVVGMRPTYGCVSRYGLVAFASSLDQIGVIARDARDCAAALKVIAGADAMDSTAVSGGELFADGDHTAFDLRGVNVGVPRSFLEKGVDHEVAAAFETALEDLKELGARVSSVDMLDPSYSVAAYYVLADCEASSNLARYDGVRYGRRAAGDSFDELVTNSRSRYLGPEVKRRIVLGTFALSSGYYDEYYLKASGARRRISADIRDKLAEVDFLATPTAPCTAFGLGERVADPLKMYLTDVFTVGPCLAGLPAISLPMGLTSEGLPTGLQLTGRAFEDRRLLAAGEAYLNATGHHRAKPPIVRHLPKGGGRAA